jgi:hypothetical protein
VPSPGCVALHVLSNLRHEPSGLRRPHRLGELALRLRGQHVKAYQKAVRSLAGWLAQYHPDVGPAELERQHIRGWLVEVRETLSSSTARVGSLQSGTSAGGWRARARLSGLRLSKLAGLKVADVNLRDRMSM